jgi:hypothetical protein
MSLRRIDAREGEGKLRTTSMRNAGLAMSASGAYDLGPALADRAFLANAQSNDEQAELLQIARRWLFPVLANGQGFGQHPLRQLWHRRDWLATTELLSLAMNLRRLQRNTKNADFLKRCRQHACSLSRDNQTGAIWELWCAAIIERAEHRVRPAANAEPGFDLWVERESGQRVRVSCKALSPSVNELAFRAMAEEIQAHLEAVLVPTDRFSIFMLLDTALQRPMIPPEELARGIREQFATRRSAQRADFVVGGWYVHVRPYHSEAPLWDGEATYSLTVASTYPKDEQRRFTSKLNDALSNLAKHCTPLPAHTTNALFVRVPPPISMKSAVELVETELAHEEHAHVGAVYLFRAQLVADGEAHLSAVLGHEYTCVFNPRATAPTAELHVELPIGKFVNEPRRMLVVGERRHDLGNVYTFTGGRRCVRAEVEGNELRFTPASRFADSYVAFGQVAGQSIRIDRPGPPNWTVIV